MKKGRVLIIEPDDFTRILLAKEIENTNNIPVEAESITQGICYLDKNKVSLIISDDDFSESNLLLSMLEEKKLDIPLITISSFENGMKQCDCLCSVKKPIDGEGYTIIREEINSLKKIV